MNGYISMHEMFRQTLKTLADLPDEQIDSLMDLVKETHVNKGDYFLQTGDIPRQFGFNLKGLFRYYYIDRKGNEFTKSFIPEGNFVISYSAMILNRESYFFIEALEDSHILLIQYNDWLKIIESHICWTRLVKVLIERAFVFKEKREKELLIDDAGTLYLTFLNEFPNMESRVKQYMIASYLGITPVALSRIRKRFKILT